ncbi:Hypothetical predicted protein, partial [Paramuricea clavata]
METEAILTKNQMLILTGPRNATSVTFYKAAYIEFRTECINYTCPNYAFNDYITSWRRAIFINVGEAHAETSPNTVRVYRIKYNPEFYCRNRLETNHDERLKQLQQRLDSSEELSKCIQITKYNISGVNVSVNVVWKLRSASILYTISCMLLMKTLHVPSNCDLIFTITNFKSTCNSISTSISAELSVTRDCWRKQVSPPEIHFDLKICENIGQNTVKKIEKMAADENYDLNENPFKPRHYLPSEQFSFTAVEREEVESIVMSMAPNKAPGNDKVPIHVIKTCLTVISPTITSIINASLLTSSFPSVWKNAEVVPIHKSGDHEIANNNRPISLLPVLSKICERAAYNQFSTYLLLNDRLSSKQSGNKHLHSTETSVIQTTDMILNAIDKKQLTAIVLLDMSKAFDSIDTTTLITKLEDVGASCQAIQWFQSYLTSRYQVVRIQTTLSDPLEYL